MILHAPHVLLYLRHLVPSVALLGSSTPYYTVAVLLRLLTLPLPRIVYRRGERALYSAYQGMVGFFFETWSGVEFCFYGDVLPARSENVLYISNHQCTVDWIIAEVLCLKQGGDGGRARYFLKDALKYVPLYGHVLGARGGLFVKRSRKQDSDWIVRKLEQFKKDNMPLWLVLYPEGTRYNPTKPSTLNKSKSYAQSVGQQCLDHVLTPHTKGFEVTMATLGDYFEAVYDVTIIYESRSGHKVRTPAPGMFGFFSGDIRRVHIHICRKLMSDIPGDVDGRRQWLYDCFVEKERIIDTYLNTGKIPAQQVSLPLPLSYSLPPTLLFASAILLSLGSGRGRQYWVIATVIFTIYGILAVRRL